MAKILIFELSDIEAASMASMVDCDGSINITRDREYYRLKMQFANSHRPTVEWVAECWGVTASPRRLNKGYKQSWETSVGGAKAQLILDRLLPFMRIKRVQAEIALAFPVGKQSKTQSDAILALRGYLHQAMKEQHKENYPSG